MNQLSPAHSRRFGGIARLYGEAALQRFHSAHVCVVGVGGVGSWSVEALARSGIGNLTLIDLDNIAESNVNRQLHALTDDFGKAKITALAERIKQINPNCRVTEIEDFVTEDNLPELFADRFDFVIDAIDQIRVKAAMAAHFVRREQPFILSGGAGGQKNPALIQTADLSRVTHDPLLANLRYTLRKRYGFSRDTSRKMNVPCVFSTENITPPVSESACDTNTAPQGLSCAGYGASMLVTASFGLYCAQAAIEHIERQK
ncbi:MAG: tRNA threonylcarbamoyladenosine dehydratase [Neisseria sp.]|uniref:tRNA threonylcarbamoyladenosine dehydratase n=1 Tax=Neisseria sp. TaxID=192066 RepID=UPI0026DA8AB9|nr:tRNA threonylcarbamoyladenosine dehydratase [Neisseria sp.]MDO4640930.1 tRNA threonylcarbamoyladenosine dehydratase [Neisseria sp.]